MINRDQQRVPGGKLKLQEEENKGEAEIVCHWKSQSKMLCLSELGLPVRGKLSEQGEGYLLVYLAYCRLCLVDEADLHFKAGLYFTDRE